MTEHPASRTGGCLCGSVRYSLASPPRTYEACHCAACRRWTGGIELGVEVPPGGATFEKTDDLKVYASSDWAERGFCGNCGSSLFWRMTAPGPMHGLLIVCAGSLDSMDGLTFASEIYIDRKPPSHAFAGDRPRLTEAEVLERAGITPTGTGETQ